MTKQLSLERFPLHLGLGAHAVPQPEFTGMEWYATYVERNAADGNEGRLVSLYSFNASWTSWERHPAGDEAVICTAGEITLIQELPDGVHRIALRVHHVGGRHGASAPLIESGPRRRRPWLAPVRHDCHGVAALPSDLMEPPAIPSSRPSLRRTPVRRDRRSEPSVADRHRRGSP